MEATMTSVPTSPLPAGFEVLGAMDELDRRMLLSKSIDERAGLALETARQLYAHDPDWITYFRETLGSHGAVARLFPTADERLAFEGTHEHAVIRGMLQELRAGQAERRQREPTRVITIRLPSSLHESLREQARDRKTSMNQLCIDRLLGR